ncbi:poly(U)-specific endoribonuclease homolog [Chelonus insularis]|uniref:poly(U)-specific endoribonuclease homolog n=1 Tax=Chelonus insularis TaxID=460826 RepID=UPI00158B6E1A|nr:poly(U)-specific endoribonuclease homolog [Chelonus insularis]
MKLCLLVSFLFIILQLSYIDARRKSSSSGSLLRRGSSSSTKGNSRPSSGGSHGSAPPSPGWNVPKQQPSVQKPSAPVNEHVSKTSSSNVQSSNWKPSGGYNTQTGTPYGNVGSNQHSPSQGYNPSVGSYQHNTHAGAPYNPSHAPGNTGYNSYGSPPGYHAPSYHPPAGHSPGYGAPPAYNPYNPSYGHSYTPGAGYNPPVGHAPQTILVQGSSRPGIGQLAKEALVFAGVSAGVNAVANRIIPGGIYGGHGNYGGSSSSGAANVPAVTHTQITYNNYYNNGTAPASEVPPAAGAPAAPLPPSIAASAPAPASAGPEPSPVVPIESASNANPPANQPTPAPSSAPANEDANFPSPTGQIVTKTDIQKLTEDLFTKDTNNAFKHITMNLQGQKMDDSTKDDAPEPLLTVKDEAYQIPTVKAVIALHDNYELDVKVKETVTPEERKEESDLLDLMLETDIMKTTMKFLADKGYIPYDEYEFKDTLKRVWFSQFKRIDSEPGSSGFETVFLAEKFDSEIIGLHNWIYYARQEAEKKLNYLGYIKQTSLGDKGAIVKLRSSLNDIIQPVTTIFVGTSPELEMALYTICFYTRPNYQCPIKLANNEFMIIANRVNYFGKDILVSAYPEI